MDRLAWFAKKSKLFRHSKISSDIAAMMRMLSVNGPLCIYHVLYIVHRLLITYNYKYWNLITDDEFVMGDILILLRMFLMSVVNLLLFHFLLCCESFSDMNGLATVLLFLSVCLQLFQISVF